MNHVGSFDRRRRFTAACAGGVAAIVLSLTAASAHASSLGLFQLHEYAGVSGSSGTPANGKLDYPSGVALDATGTVYVADGGNNEIERVSSGGALTVVAGGGSTVPTTSNTPLSATSAQLDDPEAIAVDAAGNIYIADTFHNTIDKVTPAGQLTVVAGGGSTTPSSSNTPMTATSASLANPKGIAVDSSGDVYISDTLGSQVDEVTPAGQLKIVAGTGVYGATQAGTATAEKLGYPTGLAFDSAGDLFIADYYDGLVDEVTPSDQLTIVAGDGTLTTPTNGTATQSGLDYPWGVAVDGAGDVYVSGYYGGNISVVTPDGQLTTIAGTGSNGLPTYNVVATSSALDYPEGLVTTQTGRVYVADHSSDTIDYLTSPGAPAPLISSQPSLSGTAAVGQTLSATPGGWTNYPITYGYQWQDCDASGASCTDIVGATASTYTVTAADEGYTLRVQVSAANSAGGNSVSTAVTAVVPVVTSTTPTGSQTTSTSTTASSTTASSTSTTTTGTAADAVTLSTEALQTGLEVDSNGGMSVPLSCPTAVDGVCTASGTLSIALGSATQVARTAHATAPISTSSVIARFAGVEVQSGQQKLVATHLSAATIAYLRAYGIYRVRVTLSIDNTLTDGQVVSSTEQVWLYVSALTGCRAATDTLSAHGIGVLRLGMTRRTAHRTGHYTKARYGFERYCVAGGKIRVAYATKANPGASPGHLMVALTGNPHFNIHGVTARMTVRQASARLHLTRPILVGRNAWYFITSAHADWIFKAQHGVIQEIGVTRRNLAQTRARQRYLLRHL